MAGETSRLLLVNPGGLAALPEWQECFAALLPDLQVRWLGDSTIDARAVDYVLVYEPPAGALARLPNLKLILSSGAGVDHIIKDSTVPEHVPIVRMGGEGTAQRMGEYVCFAALYLLRDIRRALIGQSARRWDHFELGKSAPSTTVGVMGLGNIGVVAARMLQSLNFRVIGWARTRKTLDGLDCFAGQEELPDFLRRSDILTCLLPGTPETRKLIRAEMIRLLPEGAALINVSRGSVIDEKDLLSALDSGRLSGAVLDVFEQEPLPPDSPLWSHPRVMVTPHIAALACRPERARYVADVISKFENGESLPNVFDPGRGY
jgi:glyoxylate/hydroxypyruvate reductase A